MDRVKGYVRVCALCAVFLTSVIFGQTSPTQTPPQLLMRVGSVAPNTNTAAVSTTIGFDKSVQTGGIPDKTDREDT